MGQWQAANEYDGQVREIKFRSLCTSPMCPPDTAMTEYQHAVLSPDKKVLVQTTNFILFFILFYFIFIVTTFFLLVFTVVFSLFLPDPNDHYTLFF